MSIDDRVRLSEADTMAAALLSAFGDEDLPVNEHPLSCAIWQSEDPDVLCDCDEDAQ